MKRTLAGWTLLLGSLATSASPAAGATPVKATPPAKVAAKDPVKTVAPGPPVDPMLLQGLRWRCIGPFRGGRVLAVAADPTEIAHFYFGSVNGGVWETRDAGRTWKPIFDGQPIGSIGALALAPSNPNVIYAGTGEADMRSDISQGDGVYRSTDGGATWARAGLADSQQIGQILVDPKDPRRVLVAALGHPYGPNAERGVFLTRDGGTNWKRVLGEGNDTGAIDLAFRPGDARVVYASLWRTRRPPWNVYPPSNGPGSGLHRSTDGGETWAPLRQGLPAEPGRIGIAVAPSRPERVYAMVDAEDGGLYRSDDGGASFVKASGDPRIWGRGWYFGGVTVEPKEPDVVYAGNTSLYRSTDAGKTFESVKGAPGGDDYHVLWIDPERPARRILGTDQGAVVSLNGGETWSSWFNQPTGQFYRLATDDRFPYWVYGSQQDSGAAGVPSMTTSQNGIEMTHFREVTAGGENDSIAPDPKDPQVIFGGRVDRLDLRTGQTRAVNATLAFPDHYRSVWTLPLVFSPRDPKALYFANQRLFRTTDGGESWTRLGPDLTREDPGTPRNLDAVSAANGGGVGPRRGVIYSIAPSRTADGDLWIGTDDGLIWRSRDAGATFTEITPRALTPWSKVTMLETSHTDRETAWAAVDRHRLDDFDPYVFRTRDGGKTWTLAVSGIPAGTFVNAVREDPKRPGLLYAGTERGVYVSVDGGDRWQSLQLNLPVTSVRDLAVHGDDVVIATHGRAFWILDDVSPLRQGTGEAGMADVFLFAPRIAQRVRPEGFTGTPMPHDEPRAANPPLGATIDYVLRRDAAGPVTLRVLDADGRPVRAYSSADPLPSPGRAEQRLSKEWKTSPVTLSTAAGAHRFVWPIRYRELPGLSNGNAFADGVWAPPGRYTVELTAGGRTLTRPLVVEPDPRLTLTPEVYRRQAALAQRVERARESVTVASKEAERLHTALTARPGKLPADLAGAAEALDRRVLEIADRERDPSTRTVGTPPRSVTGLRYLDGALETLFTAVDGADADPSPDVVKGVELAETALGSALAAWEALKSKDLSALNARLAAAGQPPLTVSEEPRR